MKKRYIFLISVPLVFCVVFGLWALMTNPNGSQDFSMLLFYALPLAIVGYIIGGIFDYVLHKKQVAGEVVEVSSKKSNYFWTKTIGLSGFTGSVVILVLPALFGTHDSSSLYGLSFVLALIITLIAIIFGGIIDATRYFLKK